MTIMSHKGYCAQVTFDPRDEIFVGRVLGTHSLISFHGSNLPHARSAFEAAVDAYLAACAADGLTPEIPDAAAGVRS